VDLRGFTSAESCPRMNKCTYTADEMAIATAAPIMQRTIATGFPLPPPNNQKQRISKGNPHDFDFAWVEHHPRTQKKIVENEEKENFLYEI